MTFERASSAYRAYPSSAFRPVSCGLTWVARPHDPNSSVDPGLVGMSLSDPVKFAVPIRGQLVPS